jgi:hypothetical protein
MDEDRKYLLPNGKEIPFYNRDQDRKSMYTNIVKVEYIRGISAGRIAVVDEKYVKDVIARGFAKIIK